MKHKYKVGDLLRQRYDIDVSKDRYLIVLKESSRNHEPGYIVFYLFERNLSNLEYTTMESSLEDNGWHKVDLNESR